MTSPRVPNQRPMKPTISQPEGKQIQEGPYSRYSNGQSNSDAYLMKTFQASPSNPVLRYKSQDEYKSLSNRLKTNNPFFNQKKKSLAYENEASQYEQAYQLGDGMHASHSVDKEFDIQGTKNTDLTNFANFVAWSRQFDTHGDLKSPNRNHTEKDRRDSPKQQQRKLPKVSQRPVTRQAGLKDNTVEPQPKFFGPLNAATVKSVASMWPQKPAANNESAPQTSLGKKRDLREVRKSDNFEMLGRLTSVEKVEMTEENQAKKKEVKSAITSVLIDHLNKYRKTREKGFFSVIGNKQEEMDFDSEFEEKLLKIEKKPIVSSPVESPERSPPPTAGAKSSHLKSPFKTFYYAPNKNVMDDEGTKETESGSYSLVVSGIQKPLDPNHMKRLKAKSNLPSGRQNMPGEPKNWFLDTLALKDLRDDARGPLYSSSFRPATGWNQKKRHYVEKINEYLEQKSKEGQTRMTSEGYEIFTENEGDGHVNHGHQGNHSVSGAIGVRFMVKKGGQAHVKVESKESKAQVKILGVSTRPVEKERREDWFWRNLELYKEFMLRVNFSFNVIVKNPDKMYPCYKYYVGQGNNAGLIKMLMRQRWWWMQVENKDANDVNFMWTQVKQNKFIEGLKMRRKGIQFDGNENASTQPGTLNEMMANNLSLNESNETDGEAVESRRSVSPSGKRARTMKEEYLRKSKSDENVVKEGYDKLLTNIESALVRNHRLQKMHFEDFEELCRLKRGTIVQVIPDPSSLRMCNHIENNFHLGNKKALLWNMRSYYDSIREDVFNYLPLTFHIQNGVEDPEFQKFLEAYIKREKEVGKAGNAWIVKPGEETNRGNGITVCSEIEEIRELVSADEIIFNGVKRTYLVQEYLTKPLLYNKRKFDIRCYFLISCINGVYKGYWYQEGYVRTATKEFNLKNLHNKQVHLTNDAIQKKFEDYGKHENGNKVSFAEFNRYLESQEGNIGFYKDIYPQIRALGIDAIRAVYGKVDPHKREHYFEVFGLDFMIGADLRAWLIEINTNPDITTTSPVLTRVIPNMVDNALKIALDPMFPPPNWTMNKKHLIPENLVENNKFELVFDELEDGPALRNVLQPDNAAMDLIFEMEDEQEDDNNQD